MIEVDLPDTEAVPELGELLVLHRLGYQGHYVPRTMKGGWAQGENRAEARSPGRERVRIAP